MQRIPRITSTCLNVYYGLGNVLWYQELRKTLRPGGFDEILFSIWIIQWGGGVGGSYKLPHSRHCIVAFQTSAFENMSASLSKHLSPIYLSINR